MLERMWDKGNAPPLLVGVQTGTVALKISMAISSENEEIIYIHIIIPQGHVFSYVHSSIICKTRTWKQPRHPSTEEWIKKMWCIYTMEYYIAVKNNDILKFVGKGMDLEKEILSEVIQTEKDKYNMYSLIRGF